MDQEKDFDDSLNLNADDYNKKSNIDSVLNLKRNESVRSYRKLLTFINEFKIKKNETPNYNEIRNFCDLNKGQVYGIPEDKIFKFMDLIEACREDDLNLNFQEYQDERSSGFMLDFDILMDEDISLIPKIKLDDLIQMFFEIFVDVINFGLKSVNPDSDTDSDPDDNSNERKTYITKHAVIIRKPQVMYKPDLKKYKDGMHILFPNIKISRKLKKFLINRILNCNAIVKVFKDVGMTLSEVLDKNSASVPLFLFGSSKIGGVPYYLYKVFSGRLFKDHVTRVYEQEQQVGNFNLICEFSVNYTATNGLIPDKFRYRQKKQFRKEVEVFNEHHKYKMDDDELDEINKDIALKNLFIPDEGYIRSLLGCLSIDRLSNYDTWIKVMFAIANTSPDYKSLAAWVSKRVPEKWNSSDFENVWNTAVNNKTSSDTKLSIRSIIYWAKEDNRKEYDEITTTSIRDIINGDIYDEVLNGDILPKQFAKYIHHMFRDKFVTDVQPSAKTHSWYEFVVPTDEMTEGSLFKWRLEEQLPDSLTVYLSDKLIIILREILAEITERITNEGDENIIGYLTVIKKNFIRSIKKLYTPTFNQQIITSAGPYFRKRGFIANLDKDRHLLGVNNGVLDLNEIKLIDTVHDYPITHSTGVKYVPYDKKNKYIRHVEKVILDLFPEDEMDAHHFIMNYIASCLDGKPKQSMILIITGVGCHAINTPILMFNGTTKKVQDINIYDEIMGDDHTPRIVQELFRGNEQMVEITSTNEKSFSVNVNHILSLKFNNLNDITLIEDKYQLTYYTLNQQYEPIKHVKLFNSHHVLYIYLIHNKNTIINENDIIDIKVCDLLKWNQSWFTKLGLYKPDNDEIYKFSIKLLNNDNFYGFELDKNHRYLTGDKFVHHNSNGKSFFFEFAKSILGSKYGIKMPLSFLTDKRSKSSGADPSLMALEYGRLCHYSETEQNEEMNTARVKEVTGQESLSGRNLYEKQRNFRPSAHHLITSNFHLTISTTDHGTWRRIKTYKFKIVFTQEPDPNNPNERLLDPKVAEEFATDDRYKEAFLSILVEYYRKLQKTYSGNILNIPCPTIEQETQEYRCNEDVVTRFIDSRAVISINSKQRMFDIIGLYKDWYLANISSNLTNNMQQLQNIMLNTKLCKYFKLENKEYVLKGIKILERDEELVKGEKYLSDH